MQALNWLVIHAGNLVQGLWAGLKNGGGAVLSWLAGILNPLLSPVLTVVNPVCAAVGDFVYGILDPLPDWLGLTLLSVLAGALMLVVFRYASNQAAIGRARDDITANLLALKLFKEELRVALRSEWQLLLALLRLQGHFLLPVLVMSLPLMLALAQMGVRYQWRPLRQGEQTLIELRLQPEYADFWQAELEAGPALAEIVGPVPGDGRLVWRVRAGQAGRHTLRFDVGGRTVEKEIVIGDGMKRVSAQRPGQQWTSQLLHPLEPPLPPDSPVRSIEILYAGTDACVCGSNYWVLYFLVVSMAAALLLKPVLKVRF